MTYTHYTHCCYNLLTLCDPGSGGGRLGHTWNFCYHRFNYRDILVCFGGVSQKNISTAYEGKKFVWGLSLNFMGGSQTIKLATFS